MDIRQVVTRQSGSFLARKLADKGPGKAGEQTKTDQVQTSALARAAGRGPSSPLRKGNQINLYIDGKQAFAGMEKLIDSAQRRIDAEFFTFDDDPTGCRFAQKLMDKARGGVEVNLLVDNLLNMPNGRLFDALKAAGVRVIRFSNGYSHPTLHPDTTTDHKKVLLVDGKAGILGGMNIGVRYEQYWHDFMVRVEGPVLYDLYDKFAENWHLSGGRPLRPVTLDLSPKGASVAQVAVTKPSQHEIRKSLMAAFDNATDHIWIASPYFLDDELVDHLKQAAGRGVKVTAVVPTMTDLKLLDYVNQITTNELLAAGIAVYDYDARNPLFHKNSFFTNLFYHGKVVTVDGIWTSIGSANADTRSLQKNQEINLNVDDPEFAREVERRIFNHDLKTRCRKAAPIKFSPLTWPVRRLIEALDFLAVVAPDQQMPSGKAAGEGLAKEPAASPPMLAAPDLT